MHQEPEKKKTKSKQCIVTAILISFIVLCGIVTTISLILFIKPNKTIDRIAVLRWNRSGITIAGNTSSPGTNPYQFRNPYDLVLDLEENLYVTDRNNHRVQKFSKGSKFGVTVAGNANGIPGNDSSSLIKCTGLTVDDDGNVYVSDHGNSRVMFWPRGSTSGIVVAGNGTYSIKLNNTLHAPYELQRDSNTGTLYIADGYNHRIMRYLSGASSGTQVAGGSTGGIGSTKLMYVWGFYLDLPTNSFIIANAYGSNIVRWCFGESNWTQLAGILGVANMTATTLIDPSDVRLDPMGNMYVADYLNHRIQFFWAGESVGTTIAGVTNQTGTNATMLNQPSSLIFDNQLNMYVADWYNHRIQKFLRY